MSHNYFRVTVSITFSQLFYTFVKWSLNDIVTCRRVRMTIMMGSRVPDILII
jgi:hypothetical protein